MRLRTLSLFVSLALAGCASAPRSDIDSLANSEFVQGSAVGYAGSEGAFSASFRRLRGRISDAEVRALIASSHARARLMGYVIALHRRPEVAMLIVERARADIGEVTFLYGCDPIGERRTISSLVADELLQIAQPTSVLLRKK